MYTFGIDVHKNESHVVVVDETDEIHQEGRVQNATLDAIAQQYAGAKAAIEATSNYYAVYDTLEEYLDVVVPDPNQTKAIGVVEATNDRLDAKVREHLRSAGLIAESYVPPKEIYCRSETQSFWPTVYVEDLARGTVARTLIESYLEVIDTLKPRTPPGSLGEKRWTGDRTSSPSTCSWVELV